MRIAFLVLISLAALLIAIFLLGRERSLAAILGPAEVGPTDFSNVQRSGKPNDYLVLPRSQNNSSPDDFSPTFSVPVTRLKEELLAIISQQPRIRQLGTSGELQFDFQQSSRFFGFPDTITVRFIELAGGKSTLAIYSRSHYGYSDLGVNRKRIQSWLALLHERLQEPDRP